MVTVTSCHERQKTDGSTFVVLEISGGVELVLSQKTNRYYATLRKCTIPFTGKIDVARLMIGQKIPGQIVRAICTPYEIINSQTGEVITCQHTWAYQASDSQELIGHTMVSDLLTTA